MCISNGTLFRRNAAANIIVFSTGTTLSSSVLQIKHGGVSFVT
jgi:hypothetical protein